MLLVLICAETSNGSESIFAQGQRVPCFEEKLSGMAAEGRASEAVDTGAGKFRAGPDRESKHP